MFLAKGDTTTAINTYAQVPSIGGCRAVQAHSELIQPSGTNKQCTHATTSFPHSPPQVLKQTPGKDAGTLLCLARAYFDVERHEEAMGALKRAYHARPGEPQVEYDMALVLHEWAFKVLEEELGQPGTAASVQRYEQARGLYAWLDLSGYHVSRFFLALFFAVLTFLCREMVKRRRTMFKKVNPLLCLLPPTPYCCSVRRTSAERGAS